MDVSISAQLSVVVIKCKNVEWQRVFKVDQEIKHFSWLCLMSHRVFLENILFSMFLFFNNAYVL